jgi:hypothetical protein
MTGWSRRIRRTPGPQELQQLRDAAHDIADQSRHVPGRARLVFSTVAECAIVSTAVISGVLASIHLYKALFPKQHDDHSNRSPEPASSGREPPRRRAPVTISDDADYGRSR